MGHVHQELRNEGRGLHEWDYVSLSEHRVVAALIKNRSRVDATYYMKAYNAVEHPLISQGVTQFSEPITVTYMDLDRLIETCGLTPGELEIVGLIMFGYGFTDIAAVKEVTVQAVNQMFNRAVDKVVKRNNSNWKKVNCGN